MSLVKLFDTVSKKKQSLNSKIQKKIKMYCCGVTPYSNVHIGHARTFFTYDILYRTLRDADFEVSWARNITDVDDKIIKRAKDEGKSCDEIVKKYTDELDSLLDDFDLLKPEFEPKATKHIPKIITLISTLIEKDYAYKTKNGVYFRVRKFPNYGKLSGNTLNDLKSGVRIEDDPLKEDPLDFALWKSAKKDEIAWDSPFGAGRPGWHIECSSMIDSLFESQVDIHMGGRDLIFPHHEAEIAQSEAYSGKDFCKVWMHTGMVKYYGEKMSKSKNNFISLIDYEKKYPCEALRLFFLSSSYRQPLDFTYEAIKENIKKLLRIYRFIEIVEELLSESKSHKRLHNDNIDDLIFLDLPTLLDKMRNCLFDDLNSQEALALWFDFIKKVNPKLIALRKLNKGYLDKDMISLETYWFKIKAWFQSCLGLFTKESRVFFESLKHYGSIQELSILDIEKTIAARDKARTEKNWQLADSLRDELMKSGVILQDTPKGTKWAYALDNIIS